MAGFALGGQTPRTPIAAVAPAFAPDRLARIYRFMQEYVDSNRIGGAVGLVLRDG